MNGNMGLLDEMVIFARNRSHMMRGYGNCDALLLLKSLPKGESLYPRGGALCRDLITTLAQLRN